MTPGCRCHMHATLKIATNTQELQRLRQGKYPKQTDKTKKKKSDSACIVLCLCPLCMFHNRAPGKISAHPKDMFVCAHKAFSGDTWHDNGGPAIEGLRQSVVQKLRDDSAHLSDEGKVRKISRSVRSPLSPGVRVYVSKRNAASLQRRIPEYPWTELPFCAIVRCVAGGFALFRW